ncbi:MAG TPA: carboxylate--amine ligase/circularly permuted type 2 ATP-grasp protein, partial [Pseudonocardia sp.]|nr:carboxylate--amine ligase/circularly permuted type 2 ATP-grasp protein [Pseudonocardia sp.]
MSGTSRIGIEEEFHVVDLATRQAAPEVDALLAQLSGEGFAPELQRSLVETNTLPCWTLDELRAEIVRLRGELAGAAHPLGLGVVAAGSLPMANPSDNDVSHGARYARMQREYQMLVREQHICGLQVHVDVPDRDVAIAVVQRVAPWLPVLLALSTSSPYWQGADSGYASSRTLVWQRWPTAGPPGPMSSAAEYDALIAALVASGTISDPGMVYFDVRPSAHLPTVELRICDACPLVDDVVLLAGMFRALVATARAEIDAGAPPPNIRHELLRAATWRAARAGLESDLVDLHGPGGPRLASPQSLVHALLRRLREPLEEAGDWEQVHALAEVALARGSAAARQRRTFGLRGEYRDVVDTLLAATQGEPLPRTPPETSPPRLPAVLAGYEVGGFDEVVATGGRVLPHYGWLFRALDQIGLDGIGRRETERDSEQRARGVTFRVSDDAADRLFPLDLIPRIVTADDWTNLQAGLTQRVRALELFLADIYGERAAIADGVLPASLASPAHGWSEHGMLARPGLPRATVSGIDLVRDRADKWFVLEDNLRVPSGIGYAITSRRLVRSVLPELEPPAGVVPVEGVPELLHKTLLAAMPAKAGPAGTVAVLSAGPSDSAWFEHRLLAESMAAPLVMPGELAVRNGVVYLCRSGAEALRLDVLYRRLDEDTLVSATGADGRPLFSALRAAILDGTVSVVNALGNGVGDDKAVYAYLPAMIEYYLGERPLLANVPTYHCADADLRAEVLGRLDELVLKPVDGYGGVGIVIGPHADAAELATVAGHIRAEPDRWVAQELVQLSTHPTFAGDRIEPRAVDLRAFVFHGERPEAAPAA